MSDNLELTQVSENQDNKETTLNTQAGELDAALTDLVDVSITGASSPVTLGDSDSVRRMVIKFTGTHPGGTLEYQVPTNKKLYTVWNAADGTVTVKTSAGTGIAVPAGVTSIVYCDGTNVVSVVDGASQKSIKQAVRVATTTAGTLASDFENGDTVDGVTLATGDRILLKDQADASENGIYTVNASGAPTRATDFDQAEELQQGVLVGVIAGTTNAQSLWMLTSAGPYTIGTTDLDWAQVSGGGGGGASAFDDLTDVNTDEYKDEHDMLVWNETAGEWQSEDIPYLLSLFVGGTPTDNERLFGHVFDRDVDFPENLSGSQGYAFVAPAADDTWDIRKNGVSIGTISFDAPYEDGITFTLSGGASFTAGDRLEIVAEYPADDTLADVALTLRGVRKS